MRPFVIAAVVLALLLLSAALVKAYDRAPLFWQTSVNDGGITVRRLHDAQAQTYCYVVYADPRIESVDYTTQSLSISCVKIR